MQNYSQADYDSLLFTNGDIHEIEGCGAYQLNIIFPRYAEFWAKYVFPNRDPNQRSKLRPGFPVELEDLINAHYSIWYHLTVTHRQIRASSNNPLEIGDPLFHLASSADMVERTLVLALITRAELTQETTRKPLLLDECIEKVKGYWAQAYSKAFAEFRDRFKPVQVTLNSSRDVIKMLLPSEYKKLFSEFVTVSGRARTYRDEVTHSPPPPLYRGPDGTIYIPKQEFITEYTPGRWSTDREPKDKSHLAPRDEVLFGLLIPLVQSINNLWPVIVSEMALIASSEKYSTAFARLEIELAESYTGISSEYLGNQTNNSLSPDVTAATRDASKYLGGTISVPYPSQSTTPSGTFDLGDEFEYPPRS